MLLADDGTPAWGWVAAAARPVPLPGPRMALEETAMTGTSLGQDLWPRVTQLPERGQG